MADSLKRKIGYAMFATPFVIFFGFMAADIGVLPTLLILGGIAAFVAWVIAAAILVHGA